MKNLTANVNNAMPLCGHIFALKFFKITFTTLQALYSNAITMTGACSVTELTEIFALFSLSFKNDTFKVIIQKQHVVSYIFTELL